MQPEEVREGGLTDISEDSGCEEKDGDARGSDAGNTSRQGALSKICHDAERAKNQILEADLRKTVFQDLEQMSAQSRELHDKRCSHSICFKEIKYLTAQCF